MKKLLLLAAPICFLLTNCNKRSNSIPPEAVKEYFRGKLNGVVFNDTTSGRILTGSNNDLQILGYHAHGGITLWIRPYTGMTGENLVNQSNQIFVGNEGGQFYAGFINGKIQGSGKINVLEITSTFIRGTFECAAPSDSSYAILPTQFVREGEFKLKKQ